jgi:hypothetical protein
LNESVINDQLEVVPPQELAEIFTHVQEDK